MGHFSHGNGTFLKSIGQDATDQMKHKGILESTGQKSVSLSKKNQWDASEVNRRESLTVK